MTSGGAGGAGRATGPSLRPARPEDVPGVWEMLRGLARYERLEAILSGSADLLRDALFGDGPPLECIVAEMDGRLVGYALFYPVFGSFRTRWRLWLEDLWVDPAARSRGVGRLLLAELARITRERDWYAVDWEVLDWNAPALEFYEHLGATRIGTDWFRYRLSGGSLAAHADEAARRRG